MSQMAERECMYQACATDPKGYVPTFPQIATRVLGLGVGYLLFRQAQSFDFGPLVTAAKNAGKAIRGGGGT